MAATTPPKKKTSLDDVLKKASRSTKTVKICVAGGLSGEYEQLTAELEERTLTWSPNDQRLGGTMKQDAHSRELAERIQELEAEMAEATVKFTFEALPAKQWSDLLVSHPDKKREKLFDPETFVPAAIAACCTDPEGFDDPEKVAALFDALSAGQQGELFEAAWEVNQAGPFGRKSSLASEVLRPSETSSPTA